MMKTSSHTEPYSYSAVARGRIPLVNEFGDHIPELSVQFFFDNLLPGLRQGLDVKATVERLKKGRRAQISKGRWTAFEPKSRNSKLKEVTCQPLARLGKAIVSASSIKDIKPLLVVKASPYAAVDTADVTRPDGCFVLNNNAVGKLDWMDIALVTEYRKHETDKYDDHTDDDDVRKVVCDMHQCMSNDPRRRFTFGITIDKAVMRLWYFSRTELLVSHKINWVEDHETVVRIFLSFMYAEPHEVGWDPTITLVKDNKGIIQYDSSGNPQLDLSIVSEDGHIVQYRTKKLILGPRSDPLSRRGTRVWVVRRLVDGEECGELAVLKDYWIAADRRTEGSILKILRGKKMDETMSTAMTNYFLTVLHDGIVLINGKPDHTRKLMTRGTEIPEPYSKFEMYVEPDYSEWRLCAGDWHSLDYYKKPRVNYRAIHPKIHYRIAFKEVCEPIYHLASLGEIFKVLNQAAIALRTMHNLRWVHRDISTGNILAYRENGELSVKVADLECAECIDEPRAQESITGTPGFIAMEVEMRQYQFLPTEYYAMPLSSSRKMDTADLKELWNGNKRKNLIPSVPDTVEVAETKPIPQFRYNHLHDLESLWWVATYFLFNKIVVRVKGDLVAKNHAQQRAEERQQDKASKLLDETGTRFVTIYANCFSQDIRCVHGSMWPTALAIDFLRRSLADCYREAEKSPDTIDCTSANELYSDFDILFGEISRQDIEIGDFKPFEWNVGQIMVGEGSDTQPDSTHSGGSQSKGKRRVEDSESDQRSVGQDAGASRSSPAPASGQPSSTRRPRHADTAGSVTSHEQEQQI